MSRRQYGMQTNENRSAIIEAAGHVFAAALARAQGSDQNARDEAGKAFDMFIDKVLSIE